MDKVSHYQSSEDALNNIWRSELRKTAEIWQEKVLVIILYLDILLCLVAIIATVIDYIDLPAKMSQSGLMGVMLMPFFLTSPLWFFLEMLVFILIALFLWFMVNVIKSGNKWPLVVLGSVSLLLALAYFSVWLWLYHFLMIYLCLSIFRSRTKRREIW
jgi:hypothetical protein